MAGQEDLLEWVDQVRQNGDEKALDRLLAALRPGIVAYLRSRVGSWPSASSVAEEIAQETLLRIAGSIDACRARSESEFRAWVRTIARRRAIDWHRRREEEFGRRVSAPTEAFASKDWVPEPSFDRDAGVAESVLWRFLAEAYEGLSPETQEAVWRRLQLGETWAEVGKAIGTTEGGAKRRWQRALARMRWEVARRVEGVEDDELRKALTRRLGGRST